MVAASFKREVWVYDVATGRERFRIKGVFTAVSPDGKSLISIGEDKQFRVRDPETGKELHQWPAPEGAASVLAFSPDSKTLFT